MILETRQQHWPDEAACAASGAALAAGAGIGNAFIELRGPLGAGKTTFARHLLQALGVKGRVKSPTYAVLESYEVAGIGAAGPGRAGDPGRLQVHHFDFYRFDDPREWEDAGFRDIFAGPGLKLVEWPDKAEGLLPVADLQLWIEPLEGAQASEGSDFETRGASRGGDGVAVRRSGQHAQGDQAAVAREVRFVAYTALGVALLAALPAEGRST